MSLYSETKRRKIKLDKMIENLSGAGNPEKEHGESQQQPVGMHICHGSGSQIGAIQLWYVYL